jgi:hypothetical protein
VVVGEVAVDDVGEPSFQRSAGFLGGLRFSEFLQVIVAPGPGMADLVDRDEVNGSVELPVPSPAESVPGLVAAGGLDRGGALKLAKWWALGNRSGSPVWPMILPATTTATPGIVVKVVPDWATSVASWSVRALMRVSRARRLLIRSRASCLRVASVAVLGRTPRSAAAA